MNFLKSLKVKNLKNQPRKYWKKNGFFVQHLNNGYWLTYFNFSSNFNTIGEVKLHIKQYLKQH
jgi:hypothetical protein